MSDTRRLPFYNPLDPTMPKRWPDHTLIVPVCAVANIGQLACDLIISTLLSKQECQLIGRLYSPALMSVVGPNAYNPGGPPSTSTEVYESKKHKLIIVQQRTSYFKSLKHLYIQELVEWSKESLFDRVLVLTSSFSQCNPDISQLDQNFASTRLQCLTTRAFETSTSCNDEKWRSLQIKSIPDRRTIKVVQDGLSFLPGSGITKLLWRSFQKAHIPAAFLVDFCSEGINIEDCYHVVSVVDKYLSLSCARVQQPQEPLSRHDTPEKHQGAAGDKYEDYQFSGDPFNNELILTCLGWVQPYSWTQATTVHD